MCLSAFFLRTILRLGAQWLAVRLVLAAVQIPADGGFQAPVKGHLWLPAQLVLDF